MNCVIYLVLLSVIIQISPSKSKDWCDKAANRCRCKEITNPKQIPSFQVDCSRSDIDLFPLQAYLPEILDQLDLSHNSLTSLPSDAAIISITLREFHLEYNNIQKLNSNFFVTVPNLELLDLSYNELSDIEFDAFQGLEKLKYLNLAVNKITTFPYQIFRPLRSLQSLSLSHNQIGQELKDIDLFAVTKLGVSVNITVLELDDIGIDSIGSEFFLKAIHLKRLTMANNPLRSVPALPQTVKYLDFSGTKINRLSPGDWMYQNLRVLLLHRISYLQTIDDYAFYNLQSLQRLEIENCYALQKFNPLAFGPLVKNNETVPTSLRRLSLASNGLTTLHESYYRLFAQLEYINLEENPWACNCDFIWIQQLNKTIHRRNFTRCHFPWSLKNRLLFELNDNDVVCNSTIAQALMPVLGSLVVILIVLIGYLVYMGPFSYRKYFYIAQESPYHGITVHSTTR